MRDIDGRRLCTRATSIVRSLAQTRSVFMVANPLRTRL